MTVCNNPFIPPSVVGTQVASSPLQYPLHPPSQTHPHTPIGYALALRGEARLLSKQVLISNCLFLALSMIPMAWLWSRVTRRGYLLKILVGAPNEDIAFCAIKIASGRQPWRGTFGWIAELEDE